VFAHEPQQTALVIIISNAMLKLDGENIVLPALWRGKCVTLLWFRLSHKYSRAREIST
jgi:hypothetical protein